jgi:hypothetical protein
LHRQTGNSDFQMTEKIKDNKQLKKGNENEKVI